MLAKNFVLAKVVYNTLAKKTTSIVTGIEDGSDQGATIVYGGHAEKGGLTQILAEEQGKLARGVLHNEISDDGVGCLRWIDVEGRGKLPSELEAVVELVPQLVARLTGENTAAYRRDLLQRLTESSKEGSHMK